MKIHEKILTHYLSCTSPVDKEGYLYKKVFETTSVQTPDQFSDPIGPNPRVSFSNPTSQKERTGTFQQRWFVLKANLLFYKERPADRHLLGVIVLEGCTVQRSEDDQRFSFALVFGPGLKTYRFLAGDHRAQESWVRALLSARHGYLSQLVGDLGRRYEGG